MNESTSLQTLAFGLLASRAYPLKTEAYLERLRLAGDHAALLSALPDGLPELLRLVESGNALEQAAQQLLGWQEDGINAVTICTPDYPLELSRISNPPIMLFYRGQGLREFQSEHALAVVGSRKANKEGCDLAYEYSKQLSQAGVCLVSGLAFGVDASAHRGALASGRACSTIAVLGNGLQTVYPAAHRDLAKEIIDAGGTLLSQFEPDERAYPANFLNRNRVIAGLACGVLVVQATDRSGSLVTARYALEEGREVMVLPGSACDPRYVGSNRLIKQGAALVTNVQDIEDILPGLSDGAGEASDDGSSSEEVLSKSQKLILKSLRENGSLSLDKLSELLLKPENFASDVLQLELGGQVERLPGNQLGLAYSRTI